MFFVCVTKYKIRELNICISSLTSAFSAFGLNFSFTMSTKYKYTYFDAKARGEVARLMFAASKTPYEDIRVQSADWPALKPKIPSGQLPMLEVDGKPYSQSIAINHFLAKRFGFYPKGKEFEELEIDIIVDDSTDMFDATVKMKFGTPESKDEAKKQVKETTCPRYLDLMEKKLKDNKTKSGYFVGKTLTLADLLVYNTLEWLVDINPNVLDKHPAMKAHRKTVAGTAGIKEWLAKRPKTEL